MKMHIDFVHEKRGKPYKCSLCDSGFMLKAGLKCQATFLSEIFWYDCRNWKKWKCDIRTYGRTDRREIWIIYLDVPYPWSKNTGGWNGRLNRFFVDPYAIELAKNGTNIIWRYSKNKQFLFHAQERGSKNELATPLWSLKYKCL